MTIDSAPRILLVDSYDSFTFNLAALCRLSIPGCSVHIIKNDELTSAQLLPALHAFSAIVIGPGPGSPLIPSDIGIIDQLWDLDRSALMPIFGVCLGLQSLGVKFGASLNRLNVVKHGQVSRIFHTGSDIFTNVSDKIEAVRYHSLHIQLPSDNNSDLEKLAWCDDGSDNGEVIMGLKHKNKPFWAVQYHPESVCTDEGGVTVLKNFWRLATRWNRLHGRKEQPLSSALRTLIGPAWPHLPLLQSPRNSSFEPPRVQHSTLHLPNISILDVCEFLGVGDESAPFVLLDSAAKPGRFSIIGCLSPSTPHIKYVIGEERVQIAQGRHSRFEHVHSDIWLWLAAFMRQRKHCGGIPDIPFWGGLIGYLSYEVGVDSLNIPLDRRPDATRHPDFNMVFVERSIVMDHQKGNLHIQSLIPGDHQWISDTKTLLNTVSCATLERIVPKDQELCSTLVSLPIREHYIDGINKAKESLFSGDSYELCLTARTRFAFPGPSSKGSSSSWDKYKTLRQSNPAPFSAYLRLHPSTLLSSSPERFLSCSRPPHSLCQLRPIKGTVQKRPEITRAIAEQMLVGSVKEVAENLMIVDLIRHDLHNIVGDDVQVKQFCGVEEFETVWQLVSVIEGKLPESSDTDGEDELGWQILRSSLPPGSMTGAPKKRSVEILQSLEDSERGIYSGVFGYWCVGGGSDWSVTIRSCFKYDDSYSSDCDESSCQPPTEEWVIGAGGAITALSDPVSEWEEMLVKLHSVLRAFKVRVDM